MLSSRRISLALCAACLLLCIIASTALAAGPATVTVRVEGLTETKLPATQVTTTTEPVVKDGKPEDACPGASAAGALQLATAGSWGGKWYPGEVKEGKFVGLGYTVETIEGESYPFEGSSFWDLWINDKAEEEHGVCGAEMQPGDQVLLFPCHYEEGKECPNPLGIEAPATADVDTPVSVTVRKYSATGVASAVAGATVTGGVIVATTDSSGQATLVFTEPGTASLAVSAPETVRVEAKICVHQGNDGTCGTTRASTTNSTTSTSTRVSPGGGGARVRPYTGPYSLVAQSGLIDGHVYGRGQAPRVLSGSILAHSAVTSVSLELRREYRGRCHAYDGARERFVSARCGHGSFFKVSSDGSYSYLLPSALAPGRYVLDVQATDAAGDHTTLARGTSRIVFYVR
jgi:hypothetical protein